MAALLPILTFHAIDDRASVISFSCRLFERALAQLHLNGYRTLSLVEFADCAGRGVSFPDKSVVITFDDGYRSVYEQAFPLLRRYGMTATVFLTTGREKSDRLPAMEGRSMLSWKEINEMHRSGIAFGAHTLTHPDLTRLPARLLEAEIVGSKAVIEDALGSPVHTFAYPFGRYDNRCRDLVSRHFICACSDRLGLFGFDADRYAMERVDAYYLRSEKLFRVLFTSFFPLYVHARSVPRRIRRAVRSVRAGIEKTSRKEYPHGRTRG